MRVGLRIDVDTFRGTRDGVPNLCRLLQRQGIVGTFFFSVGPDNMGRHLWRLLRPSFLKKMVRSRAASLYGWDILLRGTFWPGPHIGEKLGPVMRSAADDGHEIGFHAWDHHAWQVHAPTMSAREIQETLSHGHVVMAEILGQVPTCSADPGWRSTNAVLKEKETFSFHYNSDCRGTSIFLPMVNGQLLTKPQIPTTLPTYDEVVGTGEVTHETYNNHLLSLLRPDELNVLTIHAEVEGGVCLDLFDEFIRSAKQRGAEFVPLGHLLDGSDLMPGQIGWGKVAGRAGEVACQEAVS